MRFGELMRFLLYHRQWIGTQVSHNAPHQTVNLSMIAKANRIGIGKALAHGEMTYPGVTQRILTHPVGGLECYQEMMRLLEEKEALKVFVNIAE